MRTWATLSEHEIRAARTLGYSADGVDWDEELAADVEAQREAEREAEENGFEAWLEHGSGALGAAAD